jgi:uncharacterized membrane protein (DUF2068 family)
VAREPASGRLPPPGGWFSAQLRMVAMFEFAKGALALAAGAGLLAFVHRDIRDVVGELLLHLHLDPARRIPGIFVLLAERVASIDLWLLAVGAAVYSAVRFAEAYGLWLNRKWAQWLGAVSGVIYVPLELYALTKGVTPLKLATLGINLLVVAVLSEALWRGRASVKHERP